jgi:hypothetical protein
MLIFEGFFMGKSWVFMSKSLVFRSVLLVCASLIGLCFAFNALAAPPLFAVPDSAVSLQLGGLLAAGTIDLKSIEARIRHWIDTADTEVVAVVKGLAAFAPEATSLATTAEVLTGNAALVPLTQAAGDAAVHLGAIVDSHAAISDQVQALANLATNVANASGNTGVVPEIHDAVSKIQWGLQTAGVAVASLQAANTPLAATVPVASESATAQAAPSQAVTV